MQINNKTNGNKLALFAIFLTITGFALSASAVPPLVTTIAKQINVPYESFGYVFMIQYLCFTLAALIGGAVKERFGFAIHKLITVGVFGAAAVLMLGNFLQGFWWFVVWIIPLGFCDGLIETFASIMVAEYEENNSSKLISLSQMFYCIGAILGPGAMVLLLRNEISWRVVFVILGASVLAIGIFFEAVNKKKGIHSATMKTGAVKKGTNQAGVAWHRDLLFYLTAISIFLYVSIENCVGSWVAAYFEKRFGLPASSAAWRLSVFWGGIIIGRGLMVVLPARMTLWPALICAGAGMAFANVFLSFNFSPMLATGAVLLCGIACGPVWPITVMVSQNLRNSTRFTSSVIGAGAVGAAAGPLMGSYIIQYLGLSLLFPILAAGSVVLFFSILFVQRKSLAEAANGGITL